MTINTFWKSGHLVTRGITLDQFSLSSLVFRFESVRGR